MSPLTDVLPAVWRKRMYLLFALAGVVVGALTVAGVEVGKAPDVLAYLGVALGLTAASNTTSGEEDADAGHGDVSTLVLVALVVLIVLLLVGAV